jgi:hypothetical protein
MRRRRLMRPLRPRVTPYGNDCATLHIQRSDKTQGAQMLRTTLVFAAILVGTASVQAQHADRYYDGGPLMLQGPRDYDDWQSQRRGFGLDYDHSIDRPPAYQPYVGVAPPVSRPLDGGCIGCLRDPYHDRYGD